MTRTSAERTRPSKKKRHYRPKTVSLRDVRHKRQSMVPPRVIYVQNPYFELMRIGRKTVEARPNYPCLRDLVPGTLVRFSNRFTGKSFLATITTRRVHRDFVTMLRAESIKDCLPDRDPHDLQRAVNVYHSFRNDTYKYIARTHGVVSFRFQHVEPVPVHPQPTVERTKPIRRRHPTYNRDEYERNSLVAIFDYVQRKSRESKRWVE